MFWQSKALGEALKVIAALRAELESQRAQFESLLAATSSEKRELLDRLMEYAKKPPAYEPPPLDIAKLAKRGPSRLHFPGYRRSHRPPVPEPGDAK